jgi:MtaA/CmuA family methyltransferase
VTGRERVLTHLRGEAVDHLPVMPITMMFAADTVGARYRDYATDHRVLVRAQIETATRYHFDHVSAISDPAREAADLGAEIELPDDRPPAVVASRARLARKLDLAHLKPPDPLFGERMCDRIEAIRLLAQVLGREKIIEGWVEGPCAAAAGLRGMQTLMLDFFDDPDFVRDLLAFVLDLGLRFARAQVEAGADLIGIGDAAASLIGPRLYREFVLPCERALVEGVHQMGARVRLHICGRTRKLLPLLGGLSADVLDLDWMVPLCEARRQAGADQVLLGNIDPVAVLRNGTPEEVGQGIARCHREAGPRYIVGAGCEVVRDSAAANLRAMVDYARSHGPGDEMEQTT